jgi:fatty acid desaturase
MRIWKQSPKDAFLVAFSLAQLVVMPWLAAHWGQYSGLGRIATFALLLLMIGYNIIVVSHLLTHNPWFVSPRLNVLMSALNSVNIGQSVQAYRFTHVRNHHKYNNDPIGPSGTTLDTSSTFREGDAGEHASLFRYAFRGALVSMAGIVRDELFSVTRLWRVGDNEKELMALASPAPAQRALELSQVQIDRLSHFLGLAVLTIISWQWMIACYAPAFFLALALVNTQNYYEHYGARPGDRLANSVSYYGRLYNLLTFNDGYHQEHHLAPGSHWSRLPEVRDRHGALLQRAERIISPVPAIVGFLDWRRPKLHRKSSTDPTSEATDNGQSFAG